MMRGGNAMSNKWENEPSLDYFELRRRHEEYKNSQRLAKEPSQPEAEPAHAGSDDAVDAPQEIAEDVREVSETLDDIDLDAGEEDVEAVNENPNPFDSFISAFHGLRSRFGKRRGAREDEEDGDGDYDEAEDLPEDDGEDRPEAPAARSVPEGGGEALDVEDLP